MKNYKEYEKVFVGGSDIASLTLRGFVEADEVTTEWSQSCVYNLQFGSDGAYYSYIVNDDCVIPEHYKLVKTFDSWCRIYDDEGLTLKIESPKISFYRAGDFGLIIKKEGN